MKPDYYWSVRAEMMAEANRNRWEQAAKLAERERYQMVDAAKRLVHAAPSRKSEARDDEPVERRQPFSFWERIKGL